MKNILTAKILIVVGILMMIAGCIGLGLDIEHFNQVPVSIAFICIGYFLSFLSFLHQQD